VFFGVFGLTGWGMGAAVYGKAGFFLFSSLFLLTSAVDYGIIRRTGHLP
jgi:hypothetical protein